MMCTMTNVEIGVLSLMIVYIEIRLTEITKRLQII